jgi:hypothetical protein
MAHRHMKKVTSLPSGLYYTYIYHISYVAYKNHFLSWWISRFGIIAWSFYLRTMRKLPTILLVTTHKQKFPKSSYLMCITCTVRGLNLRYSYLKLWIWAPNFLFKNMYVALFDLWMDQLGTLKCTLMHNITQCVSLEVIYNLSKCLFKFYTFRANDPRRRITSIHMGMFGILGTIILNTLRPQ